jgi:hypothetical protein
MPKGEFDPEDPFGLVGLVAPAVSDADLRSMTEAIVDEYVRMGWTEADIMALFLSPAYRMTYELCRKAGEPAVRAIVRRETRRWAGVWMGRQHRETPPEGDDADDAVRVPLEALTRFSRPTEE